eukprot:PhF_6_TR34133/c0_g1_i1/m.49836
MNNASWTRAKILRAVVVITILYNALSPIFRSPEGIMRCLGPFLVDITTSERVIFKSMKQHKTPRMADCTHEPQGFPYLEKLLQPIPGPIRMISGDAYARRPFGPTLPSTYKKSNEVGWYTMGTT